MRGGKGLRRNLRAERYRHGLSAEEVGKAVGRSAHSVLLYESGKSDPPGSVLVKLSQLYGKEPKYLIEQTCEEQTN